MSVLERLSHKWRYIHITDQGTHVHCKLYNEEHRQETAELWADRASAKKGLSMTLLAMSCKVLDRTVREPAKIRLWRNMKELRKQKEMCLQGLLWLHRAA